MKGSYQAFLGASFFDRWKAELSAPTSPIIFLSGRIIPDLFSKKP